MRESPINLLAARWYIEEGRSAMEGGALNERTLRRLPFALASACLVTGALGLAMTFSERADLIPYQPVDYSLLSQAPAPSGPSSGAPGSALDGLAPESQFVANLVEEPPAPVVPAPAAPRVSAAAAPSSGLAVVAAVPATPTAEPGGVVLDAEPPPVPETPEAVSPAPASNSRPSTVSTLTVGTGTSLPSYGSRSPSANPDTPSQTDSQPTPTVSPTQKAPTPTATPTQSPSKGKGNSKKD
jgi:hypothetical protein